ncbi:hypothetical protein [Flavobacterium restrictum]|uniref:VWA domain-containing protein n=1 Tax=Flavobacterium restrictum TaxID=2594428 RepID=A0A553DS77_9FLAO|nr:hypothetical protein [Flavobacterium restrictum]TRX35634.1 hypothetical protein FNW21_14640 [Flavobacterium restrictum]
MKINIKFILLIVITSFLGSCKNQEKDEKEETIETPKTKDVSDNLNISLLLDLSDRISPTKYPNLTMEFYLRDVGYINSVSDAFTEHIRTKKVVRANDKIQLFFDPAPFNPEINKISKDLKIEINKNNISKELINKTKTIYATDPLKIYDLAIKDQHYIGSDTWKFFKDKVNDYCIEDNYRNILVILTDGYIYFENSKIKEANLTTYLTPELIRVNKLNSSDWSQKLTNQQLGFIKANNDLSNLEILVLGINPNPKNPYEEDVIKAYWTNWFESMKVKRYEIRNADLPSNINKVIKDFILKSK